MSKALWDNIFITGTVPSNITEQEAQAIVYGAWALCLSGIKPHENFGKVLSELATRFQSVANINSGRG